MHLRDPRYYDIVGSQNSVQYPRASGRIGGDWKKGIRQDNFDW